MKWLFVWLVIGLIVSYVWWHHHEQSSLKRYDGPFFLATSSENKQTVS